MTKLREMYQGIKSQDEIMEKWSDKERPLVSIICIAYNHGEFIEDALISFLSQLTSFAFEILIHDDASSDDCPSVIDKYVELYPDIIKPVIQNVNITSKGGSPSNLLMGLALGDFIAICDGDDYWCSIDKLQGQVDLLLANHESSFAFHSAFYLTDSTYRTDFFDYPKKMVLRQADIASKHFVPTCTVMFRKSCYDKVMSLALDWSKFPVRDIPLNLLLASFGSVQYQPHFASVYRKNIASITHNKSHQRRSRLSLIKMYISIFQYLTPMSKMFAMRSIVILLLGAVRTYVSSFISWLNNRVCRN